MIVISTASPDTPPAIRARCLASVDVEHRYLQQPISGHFPALIGAIAPLPDDEIVVSLDGDDWLIHPYALRAVQEAHDAGALVTYGSFVYSDGRPGFARQLVGPVRESPWVTTHLKTFRAGLFKKIRHADFQDPSGRWLENARDQALMFPLVEMAGERALYIPDVLCVYNYANSDEFREGSRFVRAEQAASTYLRSLERYNTVCWGCSPNCPGGERCPYRSC